MRTTYIIGEDEFDSLTELVPSILSQLNEEEECFFQAYYDAFSSEDFYNNNSGDVVEQLRSEYLEFITQLEGTHNTNEDLRVKLHELKTVIEGFAIAWSYTTEENLDSITSAIDSSEPDRSEPSNPGKIEKIRNFFASFWSTAPVEESEQPYNWRDNPEL